MNQRWKQVLSIAAIVVASVAAGMILTAEFGWMSGSSAQQRDAETIPPVALPSFADVAERVMPAVVSIRVSEIVSGNSVRGLDPFDFFFQPQPRFENDDEERYQDSAGSGFIISSDGYIITNNHVIEGASKVEVHYAQGEKTASAKIIGRDPETDLALLKVDVDEPLPTVRLGDSQRIRVGDWAIAIGNPLQFENTLTVGVISAKGRSLGISPVTQSFENFLQTDAAINRGNSGGPLLNLRGEVIGINTAISGMGQNIGFAVPVDTAKKIVPQLRDRGRVVRGYLGINIREVDEPIAKAFRLPGTDGVLVDRVTEDSPAEKGGVQKGDVVLRVDNQRIRSTRDLIDYVSDQPPGTKLQLTVIRDGRERKIEVAAGERPSDLVAEGGRSQRDEPARNKIGITVQELTPALRRLRSIPDNIDGLLITDVRNISPAGEAGLRENDIIREVEGEVVTSTAALQRLVDGAGSGDYLRFYITRVFGRSQTNSSYVIVRVP